MVPLSGGDNYSLNSENCEQLGVLWLSESYSYHTKNVKEDAFCGCENLFNVHITEFDNENVTMDEVKKGRKHVIKILKQVNRKRAESYAREYGISTLFI